MHPFRHRGHIITLSDKAGGGVATCPVVSGGLEKPCVRDGLLRLRVSGAVGHC